MDWILAYIKELFLTLLDVTMALGYEKIISLQCIGSYF